MANRVRWYWRDHTNVVTRLTGSVEGIETPTGLSGHGLPPLVIKRTVTPDVAGERTTSVRYGLGEVKLPLWVLAADYASLEVATNRLLDRLDGMFQGTLGRVGPEGEVLELACRAVDGLRLDQAQLIGNHTYRLNVTFQADLPFWEGEVMQFSASGSSGESWFPMGPFPRLAASQLLGKVSLDVQTQVPTYPAWLISGPGSNPRLTNKTTGQTFAFSNTTLLAGQQIVVDTRERRKFVTGPNGVNYFPKLSSYSLWPLERGINELEITMDGATDESSITIAYRERRKSP